MATHWNGANSADPRNRAPLGGRCVCGELGGDPDGLCLGHDPTPPPNAAYLASLTWGWKRRERRLREEIEALLAELAE